MKKFLIYICLIFTVSLYALDDSQKAELHKTGYIINSAVKYKDGFKLIPETFSLKKEFLDSIDSYNPELCIELLFKYAKPNLEGDNLTKMLQENLLAISEQVGIEYYSYNRNKIYPLIKKSYFVESLQQKNTVVSDPKIDLIKPEIKFTFFQEDTTFNGNFYSLISRVNNGVIWNQMDNLTSLYILRVFKSLEKGDLRVDIIIIPDSESILIYSVVQIKNPPQVTEVLGKKVNISDSVRKRIQAVIEWYLLRIKDK